MRSFLLKAESHYLLLAVYINGSLLSTISISSSVCKCQSRKGISAWIPQPIRGLDCGSLTNQRLVMRLESGIGVHTTPTLSQDQDLKNALLIPLIIFWPNGHTDTGNGCKNLQTWEKKCFMPLFWLKKAVFLTLSIKFGLVWSGNIRDVFLLKF